MIFVEKFKGNMGTTASLKTVTSLPALSHNNFLTPEGTILYGIIQKKSTSWKKFLFTFFILMVLLRINQNWKKECSKAVTQVHQNKRSYDHEFECLTFLNGNGWYNPN